MQVSTAAARVGNGEALTAIALDAPNQMLPVSQ